MKTEKDFLKRQNLKDMAKEIKSNINNGLDTLDEGIRGIVAKNPEAFVFIAALNDGEAAEEKKAMLAAGVQCVEKRIGWGVSVDDFREEIEAAVAAGKTPILSELEGADQIDGAVVVDHHNGYCREAALLQVLHLLGQQPTRWQSLVAANDSGYYPAMLALGATRAEADAVRAYDRSFQLAGQPGNWVPKFTPEVEEDAKRAIAEMVVKNGVQILHPKFDATGAPCDLLWEEGKPQNILLICGTGEIDYFGDWALCQALLGKAIGTRPASWDPSKTETVYDNFGGWTSGKPLATIDGHETGFWGGYCDPKAVEEFVCGWFAEKK